MLWSLQKKKKKKNEQHERTKAQVKPTCSLYIAIYGLVFFFDTHRINISNWFNNKHTLIIKTSIRFRMDNLS